MDTQGKPIPDVVMNCQMEKISKDSKSNATGDVLPAHQTCHGQAMNLTFSKSGFCQYKEEVIIEESPSFYLKVALKKDISKY